MTLPLHTHLAVCASVCANATPHPHPHPTPHTSHTPVGNVDRVVPASKLKQLEEVLANTAALRLAHVVAAAMYATSGPWLLQLVPTFTTTMARLVEVGCRLPTVHRRFEEHNGRRRKAVEDCATGSTDDGCLSFIMRHGELAGQLYVLTACTAQIAAELAAAPSHLPSAAGLGGSIEVLTSLLDSGLFVGGYVALACWRACSCSLLLMPALAPVPTVRSFLPGTKAAEMSRQYYASERELPLEPEPAAAAGAETPSAAAAEGDKDGASTPSDTAAAADTAAATATATAEPSASATLSDEDVEEVWAWLSEADFDAPQRGKKKDKRRLAAEVRGAVLTMEKNAGTH